MIFLVELNVVKYWCWLLIDIGWLGGMNTAGLGGVGGPYRLDGTDAVYQVSDFDKSQVPEQVTAFHLCK